MDRTPDAATGLLRANRPVFGKKIVKASPQPEVVQTEPEAEQPEPENPYAATIAAVIEEARREIGYNRPNFIRVEHPDKTAPGTLMGRVRMHVPEIDPRLR